MTLTDPRLAHGSLPLLIWTARPDGWCDYMNERWSAFTGRPTAEMLGWAWLDLVHPEDRARVTQIMRSILPVSRRVSGIANDGEAKIGPGRLSGSRRRL